MTVRFDHPYESVRTLATTHRRVGVVPHCDPSLRYTIAIPRGWGRATQVHAPIMAGRADLLGVFSPSADLNGPRLIVTVTRMRWDVDPLAWVRHGWVQAGWSIIVARWLNTPKGRFEIGAVRHRDGVTEVRRCTAFVDNARLIRVDVATPLEQWAQMHDRLWPCGPLLQLAKPTRSAHIEARREHVALGWSTVFPASWCVRSMATGSSDHHRWLVSPADAVQRSLSIRVDARPRTGTGAPQRVSELKHELRKAGLVVSRQGRPLEIAEEETLTGLVSARSYAAEAGGDERFALSVVYLNHGPLSFEYTLVVASPDRCAIDFMRGTRALELAAHRTNLCESEEHDAA